MYEYMICMQVRKIGGHDTRVGLRGQKGLFATQRIGIGTVTPRNPQPTEIPTLIIHTVGFAGFVLSKFEVYVIEPAPHKTTQGSSGGYLKSQFSIDLVDFWR